MTELNAQILQELLTEIVLLKEQVIEQDKWLKIQIGSYKDEITKLYAEIRGLLVQTNVLVNIIKQYKKKEFQ